MPFITFFYIIGNSTFYGKCCYDIISDDHSGLDNEVKYVLIKGINEYRKQKNLPKIKTINKIGILSFSESKYIPVYSSKKEIKAFDFYHISEKFEYETYINGKLIHC
jgi:hypothetical protein